MTIHQNIFRQIFEESLSIKIFPHQNFALYGISTADYELKTEVDTYVNAIISSLPVTDKPLEEIKSFQ